MTGLPVARVGLDNVVGGLILGPGASSPPVYTNTGITSTIGDLIAPHSPFVGAHLSAIIVVGSTTVFANGKAVAYLGSLCSCGHTVSSGSPNVYVEP
jgi:uncharacterized Zn-binding protein involved in type VI secretion